MVQNYSRFEMYNFAYTCTCICIVNSPGDIISHNPGESTVKVHIHCTCVLSECKDNSLNL